MDRFTRVLYSFLAALALIALFSVAQTASASYTAVPIPPVSVYTSSGVRMAQATLEVRSSAGLPTRYATSRVPVSLTSAGRLARSAMGGPVGAAILALSAASMGWEWYQEAGEWRAQVPAGPAEEYESGWMIISARDSSLRYGPVPTPDYRPAIDFLVRDWHAHGYPLSYLETVPSTGAFPYRHLCAEPSPICPNGLVGFSQEYDKPFIFQPEPIPVSDEEIGQFLDEHPQLLQDVLEDALRSGAWQQHWPEMQDTVSDIEDTLNNVPDAADKLPTTRPAESTKLPIFCEWAPVVCDFITWFREDAPVPEHPELPVEEVEPVEWSSGLGGGSCPAPYTTTFQGQRIEYSFSDACYVASTFFRPLLISLSMIAAAFIIVGARAGV